MRLLLFFFSLLITGLVAGLFVGTQLGQLRVQKGLNAEQFTFFKRRFELAVGGVMPPVMIITTLSPLPLLWVLRHDASTSLVLVAVSFGLWVASTIVTLIFNVPVNNQARTWDPAQPPADWEVLRASWHLGQTIRTALTVPSFASLLLAALIDGR